MYRTNRKTRGIFRVKSMTSNVIDRYNVLAFANFVANLTPSDLPIKVILPTVNEEITIHYSPRRNAEASAETWNKQLLLSDKFFVLSKQAKQGIIIHEEGHFIEDKWLNSTNFWDITESGVFGQPVINSRGDTYFDGLGGTFNLNESIAESYHWYISEPIRMKNEYPMAFELWTKIDRGIEFKEAFDSIEGKRTPPPHVSQPKLTSKEIGEQMIRDMAELKVKHPERFR